MLYTCFYYIYTNHNNNFKGIYRGADVNGVARQKNNGS